MIGGLRRTQTTPGFPRREASHFVGFALLALALVGASFGSAEGWGQEVQLKEKAKEAPKAQSKPKQGPVAVPPPVQGEKMAVPAVRLLPAAPAVMVPGQAIAAPPPRAAAMGVGLQFADAQRANLVLFEQQIGPQMKQLYRSEMHFLRVTCQLNKAEFELVSKECDTALKTTTSELAKVWNGPGAIRSSSDNNPRSMLSKEIAKCVQKALPAKQAALYEKELALREEAQKKTIVNGLVAKLDGILMLSVDQRAKIEKILKDHWASFAHEPRILMQGNRYFPRIPGEEISEVLTAAQRDEWNRIPKGNINYGFNIGIVQGFDDVDDFAVEELVVPPPPPPAKNADKAKAGPKS